MNKVILIALIGLALGITGTAQAMTMDSVVAKASNDLVNQATSGLGGSSTTNMSPADCRTAAGFGGQVLGANSNYAQKMGSVASLGSSGSSLKSGLSLLTAKNAASKTNLLQKAISSKGNALGGMVGQATGALGQASSLASSLKSPSSLLKTQLKSQLSVKSQSSKVAAQAKSAAKAAAKSAAKSALKKIFG